MAKQGHYHSSESGRFVTKAQADQDPNGTAWISEEEAANCCDCGCPEESDEPETGISAGNESPESDSI